MLLSLSVVCAVLLGLSSLVESAGVAVHQTIISRIRASLPPDIRSDKHLPYVMAGAFFPDMFYSCAGWGNVSEDAHWPPFLHTAVEYYLELKDGGVERAELTRFKALLYGVFTHQVADSSWHSLRMEQGLLAMLAHMDFNGDIDKAHSFLDTGADFLHLVKVADTSFYQIEWKLPGIDMIQEVFKRRGFRHIQDYEIIQCLNAGRSALLGEISVKEFTGRITIQESPLLDELLEGYFIGGIREMCGSIERCIPNLEEWFNGDLGNNSWDLCGSVKPPDTTASNVEQASLQQSTNGREGIMVSPKTALAQFGHALATGEFLNESSVAIASHEDYGSVYILPISEFMTTLDTPSSRSSIKITSPSRSPSFPYESNFGASLSSLSLFNSDLLLISEPGLSLLHLYYHSQLILTIYNKYTSSEFGKGGHKQQFTVIEKMGNDVLVGSPYDDVNGVPQQGIVRRLSAAKIQAVLLLGMNRVDVDDLTDVSFTLDPRYKLKKGYEQFGSSIGSDRHHYYIGSRGLGLVFVYDRDSLKLHHVIDGSGVKDPVPSHKRHPSKELRLFGEWIKTGSFKDDDYVLIGSSAYGNGMPGAVFVYTVNEGSIRFRKLITLKNSFGLFSNARFGYDSVVDEVRQRLYISAPSYRDHGAVFELDLETVLRASSVGGNIVIDGDEEHTQRALVLKVELLEEVDPSSIVIEGTGFQTRNGKGLTGLGRSLALVNDVLIVGEEFFGSDEYLNGDRLLTGRVGFYGLN